MKVILGPFDDGAGAASADQMRMLYRLAGQVLGASPVGDGVQLALECKFGVPLPRLLGVTRHQAFLWIDELEREWMKAKP